MADFKTLSMNARGLADKNKRTDVFQILKTLNYTIYCIEDLHSTRSEETTYEKEWRNKNRAL